jgi:hypothetical protein
LFDASAQLAALSGLGDCNLRRSFVVAIAMAFLEEHATKLFMVGALSCWQ